MTNAKLKKLSGEEWVELLWKRPQFADKCDWSKLDGEDWYNLLRFQSQFADKCDWNKCDWSKLKGYQWKNLLEKLPQFADKCDWTKLDSEERGCLFEYRPELEKVMEEALKKLGIKEATLYFGSTKLRFNFKELESLEDLNDDFIDKAFEECESDGDEGLVMDGLSIELEVDGERNYDINTKDAKIVRQDKDHGLWSDSFGNPIGEWRLMYGRCGVYTICVDGCDQSATVALKGEFDIKKLELRCTEAVEAGDKPVWLLDRASYDGKPLSLDYYEEESKGAYFLVIDGDRYAQYSHGQKLQDLKWKPIPYFPFEYWDFSEGSELWTDEDWENRTEILLKSSDKFKKLLKKHFEKAIDCEEYYYYDIDGVDFFSSGFLAEACRRNKVWAFFATDEWPDILWGSPELAQDKDLQKRIIAWADGCLSQNGFWEDDDTCCLAGYEDNVYVCYWAYLIIKCPQLADKCSDFGKINGHSACRILEHQPQLAGKFDMASLADFNSPCWQNSGWDYTKENFDNAWDCLVKAHPEFAKYVTSSSMAK